MPNQAALATATQVRPANWVHAASRGEVTAVLLVGNLYDVAKRLRDREPSLVWC